MKINIDENSIDELTELGYLDNTFGTHMPIRLDENKKDFCAIKIWHNNETKHGFACAIERYTINKITTTDIKVYEYKGNIDSHDCLYILDNLLPFIQELIDAKLIEL